MRVAKRWNRLEWNGAEPNTPEWALDNISYLLCFPENKTGSYINFCSKNALGFIFRGCFIFVMYNHLHLFKYRHEILFWLLHKCGG